MKRLLITDCFNANEYHILWTDISYKDARELYGVYITICFRDAIEPSLDGFEKFLKEQNLRARINKCEGVLKFTDIIEDLKTKQV